VTTPIIDSLRKLLLLHKSLFELAERKTEILKGNDIAELNSLLKEEQRHIYAIQQMEEQRKNATAKMVQSSDQALSALIAAVNDEERTMIVDLKERLTEVIEKLKRQNDLNQQLIQQSLQFVHLSLDMILPQPEVYNYGRRDTEDGEQSVRALFDSKA
jgi:uncharacterized protein YicC (UPF0701 family)